MNFYRQAIQFTNPTVITKESLFLARSYVASIFNPSTQGDLEHENLAQHPSLSVQAPSSVHTSSPRLSSELQQNATEALGDNIPSSPTSLSSSPSSLTDVSVNNTGQQEQQQQPGHKNNDDFITSTSSSPEIFNHLDLDNDDGEYSVAPSPPTTLPSSALSVASSLSDLPPHYRSLLPPRTTPGMLRRSFPVQDNKRGNLQQDYNTLYNKPILSAKYKPVRVPTGNNFLTLNAEDLQYLMSQDALPYYKRTKHIVMLEQKLAAARQRREQTQRLELARTRERNDGKDKVAVAARQRRWRGRLGS